MCDNSCQYLKYLTYFVTWQIKVKSTLDVTYFPQPNNQIQVYVTMLPDCSTTIALDVKPSDTIGHVKELVCAQQKIPPRMQRLMRVETFEDNQTLSACGIQNQTTLYLFYAVSSP